MLGDVEETIYVVDDDDEDEANIDNVQVGPSLEVGDAEKVRS